MTREEAKAVAEKNCKAYMSALHRHMFLNEPAPVDADYGYKTYWFYVGEYSWPISNFYAPQPYSD